jgi:hypothetical protein
MLNDEHTEPLGEPLAPVGERPIGLPPLPTVDELHHLALPLDADERLRLVARLWKSLPADHRAALLSLQLEDARDSRGASARSAVSPHIEPLWPKVRERLFDRSHISGLYSAPRRFDLATIFVVTAAYSILFGAMSALNYYFSPTIQVAVGVLVTVVAVTQAFYKDIANPRGVSIITGSVTQAVIVAIVRIFVPHSFPGPLLLVIVFYGLIFGAISGYAAGVLVGGVFLVADALRKWYARKSGTPRDDADAASSGSAEGDDSPWAN